ncbi:MAG: hypothetical protein LBK68_02585 [Candidatus Margulisbacteria bacterium]|jgi:hypothetical protein|nr:hypothetical protein [Candidatus Margulisiibacteriota bacterium]
MKQLLTLFLVILFLSGCKSSYYRTTLDTSGKEPQFIVSILSVEDEEEKESLKKVGYTAGGNINDLKSYLEQNVYIIFPNWLADKFKLSSNEGIFLVDKNNQLHHIAKNYLENKNRDGEQLKISEITADKAYELSLPLENIADPLDINALVILYNTNPWYEWLDPTNILHDDSNVAKIVYMPLIATNTENLKTLHYSLNTAEAIEADLGSGLIPFFGLFNFNTSKTPEIALAKVFDKGYPNNWGSNFIIPFGGIFNENHSEKIAGQRPVTDFFTDSLSNLQHPW